MGQTSESSRKDIIEKMNELYIQTRKKYLVQFQDKYVTLNKDKRDNVIVLNDSMIKTHLDGGLAYGIFSGGYFNKFITFDVDCAEHTAARWAALKVVFVLVESFGIRREDIHVSLSGSKGYHIDLFFDNPVSVSELKAFHRKVIEEVGDVPNGEIEFRPSWTQGVKLPLGIHQKTGRRCWFVDNETLEPIESFDYILGINKLPSSVITDMEFDLTDEQVEEFEQIARSTNIDTNTVDLSKALQSARRIIEADQLTESHTRHKVTFSIARFYYSQGLDEEDAVTEIMRILLNTPRDYFHADSKPDFWQSEAVRIAKLVYENGYELGNADRELTIYKSEILAVLQAGPFKTKQALYAMLITSKRYGKTFYFAESTAKKMLGTKSKDTVYQATKRLIEGGFIEYVRKGEVDRARSQNIGQVRYKPNKYRLLIDEPKEDEPSITVTDDSSMIEVAAELCDKKEIRQLVKRTEFNSRWSSAYSGTDDA